MSIAGNLSSSIAGYVRHLYNGTKSVFGSFFTALPYLMNVNSGEMKKEVTEQYPDPVSSRSADELPPRSRGLLYNDIERCSGCKECEEVCPVNCITVETEEDPNSSKLWVSVFDIDFARCMFCGLCVEACQPQSLVHTRQFEGAVYALPDLVASFGRGRITPEQRAKWAMVRQMRDQEGGKLIMILWLCSAIMLVSAVIAAFASDTRKSTLALWTSGLGAGGIYLAFGAELLAVVQWILSTLTAISFIFYAVTFGEYGAGTRASSSLEAPSGERGWIRAIMPIGLGLSFGCVLWLGMRGLVPPQAAEAGGMHDLFELGKVLIGDHLLSLEILAVTLLLVVVGSGVVARPESSHSAGDAGGPSEPEENRSSA